MKQHNKPKVIFVLRPRVKASSDESLANHLASTDNQWSNCGGTRGNGVPPPFLAGERRSLSLHDDSYLQHKQQKKMCVKCMI